MRPVLKAALSRIWLDEHTLQLGHGPSTGHRYRLTPGLRELVEAFDGTQDIEQLLGYAERIGVGRHGALELLDRLAEDGCLDDGSLETTALRSLSRAERGRLEPDLSSLDLRHRLPGGGVRALERRRRAAVEVHGLGRVGALAALRLAAAGIGCVVPVDSRPVQPADTGPGAYSDADVGVRRQEALTRAIRLTAPSCSTSLPATRSAADLALVAPGDAPPTVLLSELTERAVPHLRVEVCEDRARLGPLVVPGSTACGQCHDLALTDRDPLWPRVLARLAARGGGPRPACDATLASVAADNAVLHALAFLDGHSPPSLGGVIEFALPYALPERTAVTAHPACGCTLSPAAPAALSGGRLAEWAI